MGNINNRSFNKKYPGKRLKIIKFLHGELKRLKKIGFPDYDLNNISTNFTKHIINIVEDD